MPALTKKEMRPNTFGKSASETCPRALTSSRIAIAVESA